MKPDAEIARRTPQMQKRRLSLGPVAGAAPATHASNADWRVDDRAYWVPMGEAKYSFMYSTSAGPPAVSRYNLQLEVRRMPSGLAERCPKEASGKHNAADTYRLTSKGEAAMIERWAEEWRRAVTLTERRPDGSAQGTGHASSD